MENPEKEIGELRAELSDAWSHVHELTKALTGLTCGGSEFFIKRRGYYIADIPACVDWVRRRERIAHEQIVKLTVARKEAVRAVAEFEGREWDGAS